VADDKRKPLANQHQRGDFLENQHNPWDVSPATNESKQQTTSYILRFLAKRAAITAK